MQPIAAATQVPASPEDIYSLLADLREHWRLAGPWVKPLELGTDGGVVRLRGPLGLFRTARTRVVYAEAPRLLAGEADLGRTRAAVSWRLQPGDEGTWVILRADVLAVGPLDRALLLLGGRRWMRARFRGILRRLARHAARTSHEPAPVPVG